MKNILSICFLVFIVNVLHGQKNLDFEPIGIEFTIDSLSCNKHEGTIFTEFDAPYSSVFWAGPVAQFSTNPNMTVKYPGMYSIQVTDEFGGITRDTVYIEYDYSAFKMEATFPTLSCANDTVDIVLLPGGPDFNYEWVKQNSTFSAPNADTISVFEGGYYIVEITRKSDNCSIEQFSFVQVDTLPASLTFDIEKIGCNSKEISLNSDLIHWDLESFIWSGPGINASNMNEVKPKVDSIGVYYIEGISSNGCLFKDSIAVESDFTPIFLEAQEFYELNCSDVNASILIVADRIGEFEVITPNGMILEAVTDDRFILPITEIGTYIIQITADNGCTDQLSVEVDSDPVTVEAEEPYNGLDDDCDPLTLDDDLDQDGFPLVDDCNDLDASINPLAIDIPNNEIDENCDGEDLITSIYELGKAEILIYPNPFVDFVNLDIEGTLSYKTTIYELNGRQISQTFNQPLIQLPSLAVGFYFLEIQDADTGNKIVKRILKER